MTTSKTRVGIVLTGGGARAAYHAGAIRALAKLPIECGAISASGAGALNGLVLASDTDLQQASDQMIALWRQVVLSRSSALRLGPVPVAKLGLYLTLLFAAGVVPSLDDTLRRGGVGGMRAARHIRTARSAPRGDVDDLFDVLEAVIDQLNISTDADLDDTLARGFALAANNVVTPFFVAAQRSGDGLLGHLKLALTGTGMLEPEAPSYFAVHALPAAARIGAVLASSTLPFACDPHAFGGEQFIDGSFGGKTRSAGAVPVKPLLTDRSLDALIVLHTDPGASWDATDHPDLPILEIRPTRGKAESGVGYFWASDQDLANWIQLGERDTADRASMFLREAGLFERGEQAATLRRRAIDRLEE